MPGLRQKNRRVRREHVAETAAEFGVPVLARIPIDPQLARQADLGVIESFEGDMLDGAADAIEKLL